MSKFASVFRPRLLDGKVCLVTGGGTGIGKAVATELVGLGASVIIAARNTERLEQAAAQLNIIAKEHGAPPVACVTLNIRDENAVNSVLGAAIEKYGRIDCLVNNGGGQFASPAQAIKPKGWRAVVDTNLNGTWFMCQALYLNTPPLKRPGISIVNVTADSHNGFPGMAHTGAARAAVDNLTKTLAREWGPEGMRVNSVAPGIILSSGVNNYPEEHRAQFFKAGASVPSGRAGSESETASAIVFLLTPAASYVNGHTLRVDGGGSLSKEDFVTSGMLDGYRDMDGADRAERAAAVAKATAPFHLTPALAAEFGGRQETLLTAASSTRTGVSESSVSTDSKSKL
jgi:NAD(P)-dependent dehydrogenase (short-subunit alcohol dehydrogenase family)